MSFSIGDLVYLGPTGVLVIAGLFLVLLEAVALGRFRELIAGVALVGSLAAIASAVYLAQDTESVRTIFSGMLVVDNFGMSLCVLFAAVTALSVLISVPHQQEHDWGSGEYYALLILATSGMTMLAMAGHLVTVFLGIETMSIATYVLTGSRRGSRRSSEAAMKYFLMGAFATAFLLYGIALCYGATGSMTLSEIRAAVDKDPANPLLIISVFFFIVGFGFKIAAVPFHMWAPDVYDGAPTPVVGFMAAAVKAAAFAGILRVFGDAFGGEIFPVGRSGWAGISAALAAVTMTVGNVAALRQRSIKRMLAYSSISHAGVLLVGVVAMGLGVYDQARTAVVFYLIAYSVTTLGAFGMLAWIGSRDHERTLVDDWSGLASRHPMAALAMAVFMLSFGGLPPTAGFLGKFLVFKAAMSAYDQQLVWLVVVGVLNSMVSIFYYLRIVTAMYFREPVGEFKPSRAISIVVAMVICLGLVLHMGILPSMWLSYLGV